MASVTRRSPSELTFWLLPVALYPGREEDVARAAQLLHELDHPAHALQRVDLLWVHERRVSARVALHPVKPHRFHASAKPAPSSCST